MQKQVKVRDPPSKDQAAICLTKADKLNWSKADEEMRQKLKWMSMLTAPVNESLVKNLSIQTYHSGFFYHNLVSVIYIAPNLEASER